VKLLGDQLRLSATDLSNHLGCRHLTRLELAAASGKLAPPSWQDPALELLMQRGLLHEQAYVQHLRDSGLEVVQLDPDADASLIEAAGATVEAMRAGPDVIVQATLHNGRWLGRADILRRVDAASDLGTFSYEVYDTKLSRETRGGAILQLCLYSELVAEVQNRLPSCFHVVRPGMNFEPETYRVEEFLAYHRHLRAQLEGTVANGSSTYPDPVPQCDICRWWRHCDKRRRDDDHLSLVAGMTKLHQTELQGSGLVTMEMLAAAPHETFANPSRGSAAAYVRLREQARIQVEGRTSGSPVHEVLPVAPGEGVCRLPEPSPGDVFFDFEGARFVGEQGLEYLFGYVDLDEGAPQYRTLWATDAPSEKAAFETFIDEMVAQWEAHPDFHIYHFGHYEPSALKRLMGRYATREDELDRLLRAERFVDLHAIVRQAVRASVENYSLKDLEPFYDFSREEPLRQASLSLRAMETALELGRHEDIDESVYQAIERYNRDDCLSTLALRSWLEELREQAIAEGEDIPRPVHDATGEAEPNLDERLRQIAELKARLMADLPLATEDRTPAEQARWLLSELLDWHRREKKAFWWEYFRLRDLQADELLDERAAIAELEFVEDVSSERSTIHRYRFPAQEVSLKKGDSLVDLEEAQVGKVADLRPSARLIDIQKAGDAAAVHPTAVISKNFVNDKVLENRLMSLATQVLDGSIDEDGPHVAARHLLLAERPSLADQQTTIDSLRQEHEPTLDAALRLAHELNRGVLPIQGPPGTGKTYTGAHMIVSLLEAGKKVGVTGPSHKVITNLMKKVAEECKKRGVKAVLAHAASSARLAEEAELPYAGGNGQAAKKALKGAFDVLSGTPWLWAREELSECVDVLFIDEAGQMSLANAIASSMAAKNAVLLGDPQQLDQPLQGSHPPGTSVSALEHLLQGEKTMPADRGLFLEETYRLHPDICAYTSEVFYERRLASRPGLEQQAILEAANLPASGLYYVSVEHDGNHNASVEEVEVIVQLVEQLSSPNAVWRDQHGDSRPMGIDDILIVAPYNAQVVAIEEALPNARVGTVDKFQGQEAPVVIYSMATSSPDEAPRGMSFLYSLNRLNVATSRARALAILVANPRLLEPDCRTPAQMQMANAFCRYDELAVRGVTLDPP